MFNYYAFGLIISSQIKLPGVIETINDESDAKIILGKVNPLNKKFLMTDLPNYMVEDNDVYLWWEDVGKVKISKGNIIIVDSEDNNNLIISFLLGPVMSILLHQRGLLVLHGSSVNINDSAIAFLGHRGIGKSTMAINLYKKGYPIVTDDILAIDFDKEGIPSVYPGYTHIRLSEDSYKYIKNDTKILSPIRTIVGKFFCDAFNGFSPELLKLKRIYLLKEGVETRISILNAHETLIDLIRHSVAYGIFKDEDKVKNMTQCANLINNVNFRQIEVVHSMKKLPALINLIEKDILN